MIFFMKKKVFFQARWLLCGLLAVFLTTNVWADEYTLVTAVSQITTGDKVVIAANDNGNPASGVTGWNGTNDASVSATASEWVQYEVTAATNGWTLYDATAEKYIKSPTGNHFKYDESTGGVCSVNENGVLTCNSRYLQKNGSYYRMYTSINNSYTPYCVWKVTASAGGDEPAATLSSISLTGDLNDKTYENIDKLDLTGLTVTGSYTVGNPQTISSGISWQVRTSEAANDAVALDEYVLTAGQTSVDVQATVDEIPSAWVTISGLTVTEHVVTPDEYTININNALYNATAGTNLSSVPVNATVNDITITTGGSGTKARPETNCIRYYKDNTLTFAVPSGYVIKSIVFAEPTSGSQWDGSITVNNGTYTNDTKSWAGNSNSVTFSFGAQNRIATATVTYAAIVPEVTVDPSSLSFDAKQNIAVDGKTFTLTGANLTSGLTLAASAGFNVSPESITAADAMAQGGVEVTVTPATPTATTTPVEGTVTISGGGLTDNVVVNLSMAVTPTYLVAIAVNDNTMGTATINGGTASIYVTEDDEIALVATPESGHEFVNWTVSDNDIVLDDENAASTTAMAGAAGTITANFQAQACTGLAAPVLDDVTTTYQSATIAWNAVDNAEGYVLNLKKHEGNVAVVTDELIVAPTVSFEKTGLAANTQYDYTVMAVGDGTSFCDESNPLLEGNFTTNDYPSVAVTYSENNNSVSGGSKKIMTPFALPDEVTNEISGKTFVGWTTKSDFEDGDESDEETYFAKGANFTIQSNAAVTLYAVYATAAGGAASYVKLTSDAFDANAQYVIGALKSSETHYFYTYSATNANTWGKMTGDLENNTPIVFTLSGTANALKIKNSSNHYVKAVSGNFQMSTSEFSLKLNSDGTIHADLSGTDVNLRYNSSGDYGLRFYTSTTGSSAYLYKVEQNVSYSDYVINGSAALPVLDAPTFSLEAGSYYEGKSVTLSATNEAAIYYTLDGTDPTNESTLYEEAIALSTRDEYTIKAIAVKAGFETSEVATREYNIVLPYDFADFAALEKVNNKEYAVRGIISQIDELYNNSKLIYHISGNGSTEGQIKCFRGLGLNKATFTSADDVNLGDNVTVVGTWSTQYSNLNQDNWMLEYTARVHDSYEIEGGLTTTTFQVGEAFDDAILGNLSVKEVFTNGYEETVAGATFNCGDKTEWLENETTLTVYAKLDDDDLTSKNFGVTVSSATLVSFALKEGYKTEYYVGDEFVKPTVIATLSDNTHPEAEATACTGYDMSAAGNYTVNVAFTYGDITIDEGVTYQITVKAVFDNEDAPHTVAKAIELIEASAYQAKQSSTDYMWVSGKVSGFNGTSNKNYYISDDGTATGQLYVYNGSYFNGVAFTDANKLHVGDEVILKATILNYNGSTAELTNSQVVSQFRAPEFAFADIVEGDEFEANISEDLAVVPTANSGDAEFTLTSGNTDVVTIVDGKLHAVAEGNAVITATRAATANDGALNYKADSKTFNVHVIAERTRYTVTFDADGGEGTAPVIANQLAGAPVELPENTFSKESSAFAGWVVNDGAVEITDGHFTMPESNVTIKAKWNVVATCAISFMVNGAEVATANAPQTAEYTLTQTGAAVAGFTFLGWSETEYADEVENAPAMITTYTPEAGEATKVLYGIYSRLDNSAANYGKYEKATAVAEGDYLIVCENQNVAMDGSLSTLDAAGNNKAVTISDGVLTLENADNYVFTIAAITGGYSIKSKSGYYVGGKGSESNGMNSSTSTEYTNTISISNGDAEIIGNGAYMRCNPNSNNQWFRYFKASTYTGQKAIQLYKKNLGTTYYTSSPVEKVTITFNANGGNGGCTKAIINKGAEFTICENVPTKSHSEFAGWKLNETTTIYQANQNIGEVEEDITLTAQWNDAATYDVTYNVNGSSDAAPTQEAQYAGDQFEVGAAVTKEGFTFQGWKYGSKLYKAGASFTMPAEAVTFVAQWRKASVPVDKMSMVTSASALSNGMQIALGCSYGENSFAMAGDFTGSNKYMTSVTDGVSLSDGVATYTDAVVVMTLEQVENGWKITKDGTNYLNETSVKNLAWTTKENATIWSISFSGNNVKIYSANGTMKFNAQDPRFTTYASGQKDIQLFGKAVVVTEDASISDLGYVDSEVIVVEDGMTLTVDEEANLATVIVKNGSTVDMSAQLNANNLIIETKEGQSAQITNVNNLNASGDIYMDITLCDGNVDADYWYCISAPFNIDAANGFYLADGTKLTLGVDYILRTYDGQQRANTGKGWSKGVGSTLKAGRAYLIGFNNEIQMPNVLRVKAANKAIAHKTSLTLESFAAAETADQNWNAVANPNFSYVSINQDAHVFDNNSHVFNVFAYNAYTFVVGTPMFIQAAGTLNLGNEDHSQYRAPQQETESYEACVRISKADATRFDNQLYVRAAEEAAAGFEYGKDLLTMNDLTSDKAALIWTENYGKRLAIQDAPLADQIDYVLGISAPANGTYTIEQTTNDDVTVYLTYEGQIIWNLSQSAYEADLTRGVNSGYGLRLVIGRHNVVTGLDALNVGSDKAEKVIMNDQLYILRQGKAYDVAGREVK